MASESSATTVWEGSLATGSGTTSVESTALPDVAVSWPARTERTPDTTSPEELLAAAHAACYCMGLSHELDQKGNPPERLEATATVSFVPGEGVKSSRIVVRGRVPGVDAGGFEEAARRAGQDCPVSGALKGNVEITVEAALEQ
ncbi:MAG: OsmC family peroxiredoxin [Solirubrobacterales bacterium]